MRRRVGQSAVVREGGALRLVTHDDLDHIDPAHHGRDSGQIDSATEDGDSFSMSVGDKHLRDTCLAFMWNTQATAISQQRKFERLSIRDVYGPPGRVCDLQR